MPVSGKGARKILIVGEVPGAEEDKRGRAFVGPPGEILKQTLYDFGVDLYEDCWITNALICRPPNNRDPSGDEIEHCRPNLFNTLNELKPELIIPLGRFGITALMGMVWKDDVGQGHRWLGWRIPCQKLNAWICPTWHPAFILRKLERQDVECVLWKQHLEAACELRGRPWEQVPEYSKQVKRVIDTTLAAGFIDGFIDRGRPAAWDYETNMLKPDHADARIVSCSISDGETTIAYPWTERTAQATKRFILSPVPKIASNLKFEDRWTQALLDTRVAAWEWDTMIAGHIHDNRKDITSIKFQSFVHLGAEDYTYHISRFLQAKTSYEKNKIDEISINDLLLYNGLDSLLEFLVAKKQKELLGYGN